MENFLGKYKWLMETQKKSKTPQKKCKNYSELCTRIFSHIIFVLQKSQRKNEKKKKDKQTKATAMTGE